MNMKLNLVRNFLRILKLNYLGIVFLKLSVIVILSVLTENVQAQGCSIILKISNPSPVCSPSTVDLTLDAVTAGSTTGLILYYYLNPELTITVSSPAKVNAEHIISKGY
ncbi:MAG: hypothetical protein NTY07_05995 [Bacteroidia bacterium]|nr:hypothetical protein [Bacteroidia bacterium]